MSAVFNWHPLPYKPGTDLIKGTELAQTIYGQFSRFAIVETRTRVPDVFNPGHMVGDVCYNVRDAATVSDDDIKAGKRPSIVAHFATLDEATAYCDRFTVEINDDFA